MMTEIQHVVGGNNTYSSSSLVVVASSEARMLNDSNKGCFGRPAPPSLVGLCVASLAPFVAEIGVEAAVDDNVDNDESGRLIDDDDDDDCAKLCCENVCERSSVGDVRSSGSSSLGDIISLLLPSHVRQMLLAAAVRTDALSSQRKTTRSAVDKTVSALVDSSWDTLCLKGTRVSDAGLKEVLDKCSKRLRRVDISHCKELSGNALTMVVRACPYLEELRMGCAPHDAGVMPFLKLLAKKRRFAFERDVDNWEERDDAVGGGGGNSNNGMDDSSSHSSSSMDEINFGSRLQKVIWCGPAGASAVRTSAAACPSECSSSLYSSHWQLAGLELECHADTPLDECFAASLPSDFLDTSLNKLTIANDKSDWSGLHDDADVDASFDTSTVTKYKTTSKPVVHIAERFRRAYESRALRLEPKRAKNRRRKERDKAASDDDHLPKHHQLHWDA